MLVVLFVIAGITGGGQKNGSTTKTAAAATTVKAPTSTASATRAPSTTKRPPSVSVRPVVTAAPTTRATTPTTAAPVVTLPPVTHPPVTAPPATPAAAQLCGAPTNPFGYNFCQRGTTITAPNADTCSYFNCIASFSAGTGYMVECNDSTYSMSGGHSGACSHHSGEERPVYSGP